MYLNNDKCKICTYPSQYIFTAQVLKKHSVKYYKCTNCGFTQTESEYWLVDAYSDAITNQDIGLLYRNVLFSGIVQAIIKNNFNINASFLDYGGGYGVFVRLMRDRGFDFFRFDTYCENVFAKGFDGNKNVYELVTGFEVFEHLQDPLTELEKMLSHSESILFSTELQPTGTTDLSKWWYVMPETGQHIALHTKKSLEIMAKKYNLNFYTNNSSLHLFTKKKINRKVLRLLFSSRYSKLYNTIFKNPESLLLTDYNSLIAENENTI
jgi:hypothetical protein